MRKRIVIECNADGTTKLEGFGFVGTECNQAMAEFEKAMGKQVDRGNKADIQKQARVNNVNV